MLDQVKCKFSYHIVLNYCLSEGHFTAAPVPEYTMSGTYSTDRLRGARPRGSPCRPAVAGGDNFYLKQLSEYQYITLNRLLPATQAI